MGIAVYWDNDEQTILCQSIVGTWTWEDYDRSIYQAYTTIRSVNYTVHLIGDIRYSAPQSLTPAWPSLGRALRHLPDNIGLAITVGAGYFTASFYHQLAQSFPAAAKRIRHVRTMDAAHALIDNFEGFSERAV